MAIGIILIVGFVLISVFAYKSSKLERKLIKHISVVDWMSLLITPIALYIGMVFLVWGILKRPNIQILDLSDGMLIAVGLPFLIYAFVGLSVHFVSKVLSRNIDSRHRSMVYRINEIFHGKFSHYLSTICAFMTLVMISLLELNHPVAEALDRGEMRLTLGAGVILGFFAARGVFYTSNWIGGNRSLFIAACIFLVSLLLTFQALSVTFLYYPVSLFVISALVCFILLFIIRRIYIQTRLSKRKRLRFLAHLLWA